jgi:hypothetical protein
VITQRRPWVKAGVNFVLPLIKNRHGEGMQRVETYSTLEAVLNDRYRGHVTRDWVEWRELHAFDDVNGIPAGATKAWIGRQKFNYRGIGKLQALRHVISANVDQPFLEEISQLENLERLELEWPMVANSLTPLLGLKKLAFLSIDSPRNIAAFEPLLTLPALRTLIITNPKMKNLDWLRAAHHLEVIGVEGGMWNPYRIESLKPLTGLRSLQAFFGVSTKLMDKDLMPLMECPRLQFLSIASVAPQGEFERLKALKPDLVCRWFDPAVWETLCRAN